MPEEEINYLISAQKQLDAAFLNKINTEKSVLELFKCFAIMTENKIIDSKIRDAIVSRVAKLNPELFASFKDQYEFEQYAALVKNNGKN